LAALEGKRLVIAQEGEAGSKLAEAKIKAMTGSDPIACRPIYGKPKTYDARFKLVLVTNELPKIDGIDEAIWRRIDLMPFRVTIPADERDPNFRDKILEERDGILNFLIECYQEYKAACDAHPSGRGLAEPETVARELRDYRAASDTVGTFIDECCEQGGRGWKTPTKELYSAYSEWCDESGLEAVTAATFGRNMSLKGFQQHRTAKGNGWRGILLKGDEIDSHRPTGTAKRLGYLDLD
jgi:putative DNA primase/helicase